MRSSGAEQIQQFVVDPRLHVGQLSPVVVDWHEIGAVAQPMGGKELLDPIHRGVRDAGVASYDSVSVTSPKRWSWSQGDRAVDDLCPSWSPSRQIALA
jgi:hypothetical protein